MKEFRLKRTDGFIIAAFFAASSLLSFALTYAADQSNTIAASSSRLTISSIDLNTSVENISLTGNQLIAPEKIAGAYQPSDSKTFIIGHSTTVFQNLKNIRPEDMISFDGHLYQVSNIKQLEKSKIDMADILKAEPTKTIILMTCAGDKLSNQDFSDRLIITAKIAE